MSEQSINRAAVRWTEPSRTPADSLPAGNGEVAINVWTEANGDICLYLARTDAWSQDCRLLKVGKVRLTVTPPPFDEQPQVVQFLNLAHGRIEIILGNGTREVSLWLWVDANHPVVRVEAQGRSDFQLEAKLELWRTEPRELDAEVEIRSAYGLQGRGRPVIEQPDTVIRRSDQRVRWCHRNETSIFTENMQLQGLGDLVDTVGDPLLHRTFGGAIGGPGLTKVDDTTLRSSDAKRRHEVNIVLHTAQTDSLGVWVGQLDDLVAASQQDDLKTLRGDHERYWRHFWHQSWIDIRGNEAGERVAQAYALQRYLFACAGRGQYPIKFNGSLFTTDWNAPNEAFDADYRRWGGHYWFQNTRLVYWPMLMAGDFELMQTWWAFFERIRPLAEQRTRLYFNHEGASFPETMTFWGTYAEENYGWDRTDKPISQCDNGYIRWYWCGALELLAVMLDYAAFTQDDAFIRDRLLPMARSVLRFYDEHYPRDAAGKLRMEPAQALETWQKAVNPMPDVAGLMHVLDGLLALASTHITEADQQMWRRLRDETPDIPLDTAKDGSTILAQAEELLDTIRNQENPNLYAIFPHRRYGVGKPDLDLARRTFEHRVHRHLNGWYQDPIQAAMLGLTEQARDMVISDATSTYPGTWFPAYWGPHADWIPDQDNGGVLMIALQRMLLQHDGDRLLLLPAWPKEWDVSFRLHGPNRTVIEGRVKAGKVVNLKVTPKRREADVEVCGE